RTGERGGMTHGRQPLACGCLLLALLTTRSRQGGHLGQGGKHATLGARGKEDTWGKEEEATRQHFSTALHAPPLPASDAQPDLHSVLIPFLPSTLKEGGAAAWTGVNTVTDTSAGEQQLGGSTPSPTCKSLLWQVGGGAAAWRVNTITDIFRELNFPTFLHLSVLTLFPGFCLFHYTGDAAEAARGSRFCSSLLICTTCVGSTEVKTPNGGIRWSAAGEC
ncbi:unnamed protein product, partial [Closterium sp. Naga37s-1]